MPLQDLGCLPKSNICKKQEVGINGNFIFIFRFFCMQMTWYENAEKTFHFTDPFLSEIHFAKQTALLSVYPHLFAVCH